MPLRSTAVTGGPLLTLRGNATPLVRAGLVYLGYDSGEVVALRLEDGSLVWEQSVATPEGRSELDRLADIDGKAVERVAAGLREGGGEALPAVVIAGNGENRHFQAGEKLPRRRVLLVSAVVDDIASVDHRIGQVLAIRIQCRVDWVPFPGRVAGDL